ncbi:hypothetical protein SAMN05444392_102203 [Seinonella peptonophila]|uniref:Uncharacterized protein n=1 Tax=Seinonella peptonophila TaxID=112248 RepID=A0A1M4V751_9BACL|nr:hypothetical protein [Seinonella peptonophila]SHE64693.1 hypothetical protein SAMN05444392_102203 [Seinonella peptonophila]
MQQQQPPLTVLYLTSWLICSPPVTRCKLIVRRVSERSPFQSYIQEKMAETKPDLVIIGGSTGSQHVEVVQHYYMPYRFEWGQICNVPHYNSNVPADVIERLQREGMSLNEVTKSSSSSSNHLAYYVASYARELFESEGKVVHHTLVQLPERFAGGKQAPIIAQLARSWTETRRKMSN